jgi:hypothetical protein
MFLIDYRREYASEFIAVGGQTYHHDDRILLVQQWMEIHLSTSINLEQLADRSSMVYAPLNAVLKTLQAKHPCSSYKSYVWNRAKTCYDTLIRTLQKSRGLLGMEIPGTLTVSLNAILAQHQLGGAKKPKELRFSLLYLRSKRYCIFQQ